MFSFYHMTVVLSIKFLLESSLILVYNKDILWCYEGASMEFQINYAEYSQNEYPLHKHNYYEIIAYTSGCGQFHSNTADFSVAQGTIVVVPPGVMHGTKPLGELRSLYVGGEFAQVFNFTAPVLLRDNAEQEGLALAGMIYRNRYENGDYLLALCNAYTHFIMQNLKMEDGIGLAVKDIIHGIMEHFHDVDIDLRMLLMQSGYAEDYIRAQFKRITGKTPNGFLTEVRMKHACYLIDIYKNVLSLADIAEQCGYTDYVYFSRRFKQTMGVSPHKYKNNGI